MKKMFNIRALLTIRLHSHSCGYAFFGLCKADKLGYRRPLRGCITRHDCGLLRSGAVEQGLLSG